MRWPHGLSPTVMRYLSRVVKLVAGTKVQLGVCGEMGGRPLEAMALLGIGIERLSITIIPWLAVSLAVLFLVTYLPSDVVLVISHLVD